MLKIETDENGVIFNIRVQPKSSLNKVAGIYGDALKVKIMAPPVEGAANKMCIAVLAKALKVPKSTVKILSGHTSKNKRLMVNVSQAEDSVKEILRLKKRVRFLCD